MGILERNKMARASGRSTLPDDISLRRIEEVSD